MWKSETVTDRLVNIIHTIKLEQKSGVLTVRRGEYGTLEEGTVVFVNGQMTEATLGHRSGLVALNRLSAWGRCRYTFLPSTPDLVPPAPSLPTTSLELQPYVEARPSAPLPRVPDIRSVVKVPMTSPLPSPKTYGASKNVDEKKSIEQYAVPRALRTLQESLYLADQLQLSRVHKRLLLLVDGRRSIAELTRLMGRNSDEICALLHYLEYLGVIYIGDN